MRLAINLTLSLGMLALCTWLVWPAPQARDQLKDVLDGFALVDFAPYVAAWLGLQVVVHLCRSLRWNHLLAPLGVRVPAGPLLAISSVGFMAILALPARLGELVRPGLMRKYTSGSAALGTVAVERIIDGLIISLVVFCAFVALHGAGSPDWMMPTAYVALAVFGVALVSLVFALWRPERTVAFGIAVTLLPRFAPRFAVVLERRALDMIRGFAALKDVRNLMAFVMWSVVYWSANGLGMWVLARPFGLELSLVGAYATMGLLGVGISLPNSPGLVGQFQWFTLLGLSLYLGFDAKPAAGEETQLYTLAFAYSIVQHLLQVAWYVAMGALGLASPWVSVNDLRVARKATPDETRSPAAAPPRAALATSRRDGEKLAPEPRSTDDRAHAPDRS
jgi:glycosyltransferase 2 family protein